MELVESGVAEAWHQKLLMTRDLCFLNGDRVQPPCAFEELLLDAFHDERLPPKERKLCLHGQQRIIQWNEARVRAVSKSA